jgi:AraC-like DNA-binding protein
MLSATQLLDHGGVEVTDVICRLPAGHGHTDQADHHAIVFVRRGYFIRNVDGTSALLDPTQAYLINPDQEQRYDHPGAHGDDCTSIRLDPSVLASLWGGDPTLSSTVVTSSPQTDLEHRLLIASARRGEARDSLYEQAVSLVAATLEQIDTRRVASGRPASVRARRALVDSVREAMAVDPDRSLRELAEMLDVSVHHLSRTFRAGTGHTIARHRVRLRVRAALEHLAGGERRLAKLAADVGFVDQSHLCRAIREELGHTPSALRRALS